MSILSVAAVAARMFVFVATCVENIAQLSYFRPLRLPAVLLAVATAMLATPSLAQDSVSRFVLINADTDQDIGPISDGDVLVLGSLPTANLAIRADTVPATVGSVRFDLDGTVGFRTENAAPYALFGDGNGNYKAWTGVPLVAAHSLTATPFTNKSGGGIAGTPLTIAFEIVQSPIGNVAPVLAPIGNRTVGVGQTAIIPVSASDANSGDLLTLSASGLPAFASFVDSGLGDGSGTLTISPQAGDEGTYPGNTITVTDDASPPLEDFETFSIIVGPAGDQVVALVLINADTDQDIGPISNGDVIVLDSLPTANLAIRADTVSATVGSVRFDLDGTVGFRTENTAPYALFGDANGNYKPWSGAPLIAAHSLTATPFSNKNGSGTVGTPRTVSFQVVQSPAGNIAPVLATIGNRTVEVGETAIIPVSASDANSGDLLTLNASGLPSFASFVDGGVGDGSGTLTIAPQSGDEGVYPGNKITVTDDGSPPLEDFETFSITVGDVVAPVVGVNLLTTQDSTPALTGPVDDPTATIDVTVNGATYAAQNLGSSWLLPDNTITPALTPGIYDVSVVATDPASNVGSDSTTNELTVLEPGGGDQVAAFILINADTDQDIGPLSDGDVLDLSSLPTANLAIRAETLPATVGSVRFDLDGDVGFRTESTAPYALFGDSNGNYAPWSGVPLAGIHSLTATPFSGTGASGTAGTPLTVGFEIVDPGGGSGSLFIWESRATAPIPRYEAQGLPVDGLLYVFGGFFTNAGGPHVTAQCDAYDPAANVWLPLSDMPEALTHAGQAADGPTVYLAGGFIGDHPGPSTDHVWTYDTATDFWTAGPPLPADRGGGGLVRIGRKLHYFGGATRPAGVNLITDFPDHWVLDLGPTDSPADDGTSWTSAAPMPNPRNHIGSAGVGGLAYAIGGQHSENEASGNQVSVDAYDPGTNTWTAVADLPSGRGHIAASTFLMNGRIVVTGGVTNNGKTADVLEYDPASNIWVKLPDLPAARQSPVSGFINNRMFVTGGSLTAIEKTTWSGLIADKWDRLEALPVALGEVSSGVIDGTLYVVGEGDPATLALDLSTGHWEPASSRAVRPFPGNHHAAEVFDGELYLLGGLGSSSEGTVQIYDPVADSWQLGTSAPFAAGSSASALIGGKMYFAGGIIGSATTAQTAVYNPATNAWSSLAAMPLGVNHAAAATDGTRLFIFGGRTGGNVVSNGFDAVQIYDPATNTWDSSTLQGSAIAPLPQARGGGGKAVFFGGEFYVFGGETLNGPGATANHVYDRVDIYDPTANTWRTGTAMLTARHGIFPLLQSGRVYVAGGGVKSANSQSTVNDAYNPSAGN